MARKKKKVRIALPDGITLRDVKQAIARLREERRNANPLDVAVRLVAEREAAEVSEAAAENAPPPEGTLT